MVLASFAEIVSIGAVVPFLGALTSPESIFEHPMAQSFITLLAHFTRTTFISTDN